MNEEQLRKMLQELVPASNEAGQAARRFLWAFARLAHCDALEVLHALEEVVADGSEDADDDEAFEVRARTVDILDDCFREWWELVHEVELS